MNYSCRGLFYQPISRIIAHPIFIVNTALARYKRFYHGSCRVIFLPFEQMHFRV